MNSSGVLSIITFVYGLVAFCYIFAWTFKKPTVSKAATWVALIGLAGNIVGIVMRWVESYQLGFGHAPLSNLYESLVFFAGTLAMAYASLSPNISDRIQPLIPALKSNWLIAHVIACFIGYGAFAVAFGVSLMYLMKQKSADDTGSMMSHLPDANVLDELNHQLVMFGFLFLSAGIITGAVWANSAWGRYWGWDPKETWSLITWFVYATLLHARLMRGWRGKRTAILSIGGFAAVMFTYFGVNLLPGLHSYGSF